MMIEIIALITSLISLILTAYIAYFQNRQFTISQNETVMSAVAADIQQTEDQGYKDLLMVKYRSALHTRTVIAEELQKLSTSWPGKIISIMVAISLPFKRKDRELVRQAQIGSTRVETEVNQYLQITKG